MMQIDGKISSPSCQTYGTCFVNNTLISNMEHPPHMDLDQVVISRNVHFIGKPGLALIPTWISYGINYKEWDEITISPPKFNDAVTEVWKWIRDVIPHFPGHIISYPCWY